MQKYSLIIFFGEDKYLTKDFTFDFIIQGYVGLHSDSAKY